MRDNKAFASLTSGLLARKGQARPAMRPQGFVHGMSHAEDLGWNDMGYHESGQDLPRVAGLRLPANLSGATSEAVVADVPAVVLQREEIEREFAAPEAESAAELTPTVVEVPAAKASKPLGNARRTPRAAKAVATLTPEVTVREAGRKAAFTLRLDAERHLRLRLACAVQNRSAQQVVTEALDRLLGDLPDVTRLAASLPAGTDAHQR